MQLIREGSIDNKVKDSKAEIDKAISGQYDNRVTFEIKKPDEYGIEKKIGTDSACEHQYGQEHLGLKVDYSKIWEHMGNAALKGDGQESHAQKERTEKKGEMEYSEAEDSVQRTQQKVILKSSENMAVEEKERFSYWQEFNKVLLLLYHKLSGIRTDEINYGAINQPSFI